MYKKVKCTSLSRVQNKKGLVIFLIGLTAGFISAAKLFYKKENILLNSKTNLHFEQGNYEVREDLFDKVRILCWIMATPKNIVEKSQHAAKTWGKRCNKILIMSTQPDESFDFTVVALNAEEGWEKLWGKAKSSLQYIYENHFEFDWYLKADDDTYVIMENLRYFLYPYPPEFAVHFGYRLKVLPDSGFVPQGYMSGGAGYVLSKTALEKLVLEAFPNKTLCAPGNFGAEDLELGKCLANINVPAGDSRDGKRGRFLPFDPIQHIFIGKPDAERWYWQMAYYRMYDGLECCSNRAISFHKIPPLQMYLLEYLVYHLRPFGIGETVEQLPTRMTIEETREKIKNQESEWIMQDT